MPSWHSQNKPRLAFGTEWHSFISTFSRILESHCLGPSTWLDYHHWRWVGRSASKEIARKSFRTTFNKARPIACVLPQCYLKTPLGICPVSISKVKLCIFKSRSKVSLSKQSKAVSWATRSYKRLPLPGGTEVSPGVNIYPFRLIPGYCSSMNLRMLSLLQTMSEPKQINVWIQKERVR